jgi:signal transduction histidine kinase/CheY-like chemotaxis protein
MTTSVLSTEPAVNGTAGPEPVADPAPAAQDYPAGVPSTLSAERIPLSTLVRHYGAVRDDLPLEELEKVFRDEKVDFLALISEGKVVGMCSRVRLGSLLGSRFGFALYSRSPARTVQVANPLIFLPSTPVREMLDLSLARRASEFQEDVILVDEERRLLGLIPIESIACLQTRLVNEQLAELKRQHRMLQHQNLELFQTNHALRQAQGLYRGLFESNALGVALMDANGKIQAHNRRLAELLNLAHSQAEIFCFSGFMLEHDYAQFSCLLASHAQEAKDAGPAIREYMLQVQGRGSRLFRFTTGWIHETGQVCACLDDITEQRALEHNMTRKEKQRLLDTLVGGIAHELNNKMTPIIGFAELLETRADSDTREYAALIGKSTQEACRIIRQLLQLSKPDLGRPKRIDLGVVVEEALLMLKFQLRESRCELRVNRGPEAVVVMADPAQIKQVVINLVLNAVQAMGSVEHPRINVTVSHSGDRAFLSVADNGTGIAPENLCRIFDPFFTTKGPDSGTGLGLSICFSIARQHGGDIAVDSRPGAGATFTFALPRNLGAVEPAEDAEAAVAPKLGPRKARVLVAEDEGVVRMVLQEMLRSHFGCHVDLAPNGAEALALAEESDYDLVISDIRMPVMAGTEFYLRLRELQPDLARRFTFITGHPGEQSLRNEIAQWNVPVLAKPFTLSRLVEICRPLLLVEDMAAKKSA